MYRLIALTLSLAACASVDTPVTEFWHHVETGSRWTLTFGSGTADAGFTGACPTLAPETLQTPSDSVTCPTGCQCLFFFSNDADDKDASLATPTKVWATYSHTCNDGSSVDCATIVFFNAAGLDERPKSCVWTQQSTHGHCTYMASTSED